MFSSSLRRARLCAAVVAALGAPFAAAAETPGVHHAGHSGPHFTLAEALARAQARHPLFASYRAQLRPPMRAPSRPAFVRRRC